MKQTPTTATILQRARQERSARSSSALDKLIINIALGAGFCWAGADLLVESLSSPGRVYTVSAGACDCRATRPCWHGRFYALLLAMDPPAPEPNPLGDTEDDPDYVARALLGARMAIARRSRIEAL
jgi:hypothetical protein